jgi:hypothetical protein
MNHVLLVIFWLISSVAVLAMGYWMGVRAAAGKMREMVASYEAIVKDARDISTDFAVMEKVISNAAKLLIHDIKQVLGI